MRENNFSFSLALNQQSNVTILKQLFFNFNGREPHLFSVKRSPHILKKSFGSEITKEPKHQQQQLKIQIYVYTNESIRIFIKTHCEF